MVARLLQGENQVYSVRCRVCKSGCVSRGGCAISGNAARFGTGQLRALLYFGILTWGFLDLVAIGFTIGQERKRVSEMEAEDLSCFEPVPSIRGLRRGRDGRSCPSTRLPLIAGPDRLFEGQDGTQLVPCDGMRVAPLSLRVEWKHSTEVLCLSLDTDDHHSWTSLRAQKVRWPRIAVVATRSEHATLAVNSPLSAQAQVCDRVRRDAAHSTQAHSAPRATTCFIS